MYKEKSVGRVQEELNGKNILLDCELQTDGSGCWSYETEDGFRLKGHKCNN